ncbi:MAG: DNA-3-methyladenine glycosylase 2 family protein [Pseudonocardiales bacterium]|nr:DNA-3-methyladenine glycosylase 2 family protein [Pseudonocardiales bacterium]
MSESRSWMPQYPLDLRAVLAPLRRGRGDPTMRVDADGSVWRAGTTPAGAVTMVLRRDSGGVVHATGWGPGAVWALDSLPALLGADDDDSSFVPHHPLVSQIRRRMPGLRLGATRRVWDVLVPAVLEQKVTGVEARRSWRELCWRFGQPAPGLGAGLGALRVPPTPAAVRAIPDWEWHRAGVDHSRRRALLAAAAVAHRLEAAVVLAGKAGRDLLCKVPGIGIWTAAEVAQRAWADADAVSIGDYHIPSVVGYALVGRALDDAGMLEILAPYTPHRHRAVRYIEASGCRRPRFGPRFSPRDYRAM